MSKLRNITKRVRSKLKNLRARIVPAAILILVMMVLAVSFVTDTASAATSDQEIRVGAPIITYIFLAVAVGCLILWKLTEEALLLYGLFIFAALALVTYYF
ncbi:MAG: hypothetical protein SA339_05060 [Methanomassiliicoccus sp.]|nr:hypothetical protein [Methanomassiliicoccus sp.]